MAHIYDSLHDCIGVSGIPGCVPGGDAIGVFLMDIQLILSLLLGFCACLYMIRKIIGKFHIYGQKPQCGECNLVEEKVPIDK